MCSKVEKCPDKITPDVVRTFIIGPLKSSVINVRLFN